MSPHVILASDLDHTMVQNEDPTHKRLLAFNHIWTDHCRKGADLLVFSTGRSPLLFTRLWRSAPLLTPDVLICSVGTEIYYNQGSAVARLLGPAAKDTQGYQRGWALFRPDEGWERSLSDGWNRSAIDELVSSRFPKLVKQAASEQRPHKISYVLQPFTASTPNATDPAYDTSVEPPKRVVQRLAEELKDKGIKAKVIFSAGRDVDILPEGAGKGRALAFLLQQLKSAGWPNDIAVASGDSGNDAELMEVPGVYGCVVSNAHAELKQHAADMAKQGQADHILLAKNPCAAGILEALLHFGAVPSSSPALHHMAHIFQSPITLQAPASDAATPLEGRATAQHGPDTTATPAGAAHAAPGGATVIEGPAADVPDGSAAIDAAAISVASHFPNASAGGPAPPAAAVAHPAASALLKGTSLQGYDIESAQHEWVFRLAGVLAGELSAGWLPPGDDTPADDKCLLPHSNLRLFITNECKFTLSAPVLRPWASGMLERKLSSLGSVELADDLSPEGAKDATAHDATFLARRRMWVDQLRVQSVATGEGQGAAAGEGQRLRFTAEFKVCLLTQNGLRSPACWEGRVEAGMPASPVPEAFLAHTISVSPALDQDRLTPQFENGDD